MYANEIDQGTTVAKRRKSRKIRTPIWVILSIFATIFINAYALHELMLVANSWKASFLPGSVTTQLTQLAIILGANCVVIVYLLARHFAR